MNNIKQKCIDKLKRTADEIRDNIPYITVNGRYNDQSGENRIHWWTNSFWAGILWKLYDETNDKKYADYAIGIEKKIEKELYNYTRLDHDLGFLWLLTGVEHYKHFNDGRAYSDSLLAASILASRFDIRNGIINAWNGKEKRGIAIIDSMMNLPLLYWAGKELKNDNFTEIAKCHADNILKYFFRENGSVCHVMQFSQENEPIEIEGQGLSVGSSWTRGQAWAIYGFIQSYQWTRDEKYLKASEKTANYFIREAEKNNWKIKSDFLQPDDVELYDTSAAAASACGLIKLYKETGDKLYLEAAAKLIKICDEFFCPWDDKCDQALLNYGCCMYKEKCHYALVYGDYYFFKAVCELDRLI